MAKSGAAIETSNRRSLMNNLKSVMWMILALAVAAPALTACNTTEGVGEDIASTGRAIDRAAENNH